MDWIDANQLGRRNLKPDQLSYIRGRLYNRRKKAGARTDLLPHCQKVDTAQVIADAHGVSSRTIIRDGKREGSIGGVCGGQPMAACTAFVCLLNTVFEKQRSDGKRRKGQHPRTDHSVEAL